MTHIQLTETQTVILTAACARGDREIFPLPATIKGGAVTAVIKSLTKKGLIERFAGGQGWEHDPEHGPMSYRATRLAFETLGIDEDDPPASIGPEQAGEAETTETDETGVPEETATQGDTGAGDAPAGPVANDETTPGEDADTGADSEPEPVTVRWRPLAIVEPAEEAEDEMATEEPRDPLAAGWAIAGVDILGKLGSAIREAGFTDDDAAPICDWLATTIAKKTATPRQRDTPNKTDLLVSMLTQPEGATIEQLVEATGWQQHSTRAAISHIVKKKMGLTVISEKIDGRGRVYRVSD